MQDIDLLYADSDPVQRDRLAQSVAALGLSIHAIPPGDLAASLTEFRPHCLLVEAGTPLPDVRCRRIVFCSSEDLRVGVRDVKSGALDLLLVPLDPEAVASAVRDTPVLPSGLTLHHSDDQVRVILEASPIPQLVSRASDGTILYINDHLSALLGMTSRELLGEATPDFYFDPADRQQVLEALRVDGHLFNHELRIKNKNGESLWVLSSMVSTLLNDEAVIIVGLYDITERKRIEEALRESQEIFTQLTDTIDDVFWMYDIVEDRRVFASPGFRQKFGEFGPETTYVDIAHPDDKAELQRLMDEAWGKPKTVECQFRIILADGSIRWIRSRGFPILNSAGEVYRYCGLDSDVTEQIAQQEALRESEARFLQLTNHIDDVFWIFDLEEDRTVFVSPIFRELYGGMLGEDMTYIDIVHPDDKARVEAIMEAGFADPKDSNDTYRVVRKDGTVRWINSRGFVVKNAEGEIYRYCGLNVDITDRMAQEEALRQSEATVRKALEDMEQANRNLREAQTQLVQSEKMASLGNLVAGVAHEINTPIGAINSMHDTLIRGIERLKDALEEKLPGLIAEDNSFSRPFKVIEEANRVIQTGTDRVTTIVRSLRSFARLDEAEMKEVRLDECLDDALTLVRHEVKGRVLVEKDYGETPPIVCYPSRLNQVFLNILVNAAQAIQGEGTIRIRTVTVGSSRVRVDIQDDGPGIAEADLERIFDPGFTTKGVGVGTGLGLSICYQIVQDHHGTITVESEVGAGTTFSITLPLDASVVPDATAEQ